MGPQCGGGEEEDGGGGNAQALGSGYIWKNLGRCGQGRELYLLVGNAMLKSLWARDRAVKVNLPAPGTCMRGSHFSYTTTK